MRSFDKIAVFHYHLLPGGVTSVILLSLKALIRHDTALTDILLVTGSDENTPAVAETLISIAREAGRDIRIDVNILPEIGYITPGEAGDIDRRNLADRLASGYGDCFWWVHNYHLGKNPVFTAALIEAAAENPDIPILLHIHDFPEDGRYHNLAFLRHIAGSSVYPVLPNLRYAVINRRDEEYLKAAGIPGEAVFFLNNPVEFVPPPEIDPPEIRRRIEGAFGGEFPSYSPDKPLWLYPVRTIRRKNALEAALLCRAVGANLLVTLPGVSKQEKPYSDLVEGLYRHGLIPGMWGIGRRIEKAGIDFHSLAVSADAIVSSSIQEGFGYLYADAVGWDRPLVARNLRVLEGIRDLFSGHPAVFYDHLDVPLEPGDISLIRERYIRRDSLPGSSATVREFLDGLSAGTADFASLPAEMQADMLDRSRSTGFLDEIKGLNSSLFTGIGNLRGAGSRGGADTLARFGPAAFYSSFSDIIESLERRSALPPAGPAIQERLLDLFVESNARHILSEYRGM